MHPRWTLDGSWDGPNMTPDELRMEPKLTSPDGPRMEPKITPDELRMNPKYDLGWTPDGPQNDLGWTPDGPQKELGRAPDLSLIHI